MYQFYHSSVLYVVYCRLYIVCPANHFPPFSTLTFSHLNFSSLLPPTFQIQPPSPLLPFHSPLLASIGGPPVASPCVPRSSPLDESRLRLQCTDTRLALLSRTTLTIPRLDPQTTMAIPSRIHIIRDPK